MSAESGKPVVVAAVDLRRNYLLLGFFAMVGLTGAFVTRVAGDAGIWGCFLVAWSVIIGGVALARNSFPWKRRLTLRADADGLVLEGVRRIARGDIDTAYVEPGPENSVLRVRHRSGERLALAIPNANVGHAILDAIELGPEHRCAAFRAMSPMATAAAGRVPGAAVALGALVVSVVASLVSMAAFGVPGAIPLLVFLLGVVLWNVPRRVVVGADGVQTSWLGVRRYIAFDRVADVLSPGGWPVRVALQLHRGGVQRLAGKKNDDREAMRGSDDLALAERVRRAFAAYRLHAHREDPTPLLSRGRRSVADWIRDVAALASARGAGYRQASLDEGHLWRILRDASAPPSTRVGAAVALVSANEQDRPALKEAAAACANPRVRVALETVAASPEGQEWVGALDALTNDEEKRQA